MKNESGFVIVRLVKGLNSMDKRKRNNFVSRLFILIVAFFIINTYFPMAETQVIASEASETSEELEPDNLLKEYQEFQSRFEAIEKEADITLSGFQIIGEHVFPAVLESFGEVTFIPALDQKYNRLALFLTDGAGRILFKTQQLETNNRNMGALKQPNAGVVSVAFQDVDQDDLTDIILITSCVNETGVYANQPYKVGDVLFQSEKGFYRDYRLSDKINRFSMNKSAEFITAFVRDGYSTEFLYTATTLDELQKKGFHIIAEQSYTRSFEKLGKLKVVPGTYRMANCDVFMIYLINKDGYIVWSFQPMEDYDNLYALKGINCRDIDGDSLKDIVVLARYSNEDQGELAIKTDYSIYYQRTGGFYEETDYENMYQCNGNETMEELIREARTYWGWEIEE